ncbi:MAG: GGDEF domain-containing protein, partial [Candidatus Bipolaricaulia bacterium]
SEEDELVLESLAGQMAIALSNIKRKRELRELSLRDPLTGLYNRRHLGEAVARELERGRRYGHSLAFLMIDLDNFREVNNRYGHLKGDEVLCEIAELLVRNVRATDMVFRYGGDEFLILMPETDSEAQQAIERLKRAV